MTEAEQVMLDLLREKGFIPRLSLVTNDTQTNREGDGGLHGDGTPDFFFGITNGKGSGQGDGYSYGSSVTDASSGVGFWEGDGFSDYNGNNGQSYEHVFPD